MLTVRRSTTNGLEEVSRDSIPDLLRRSDAKLWFHVDAPTDEELRFLEEELKIHHLTLEDIVQQNQRPKIESFEDYVYMAIHPLLCKKKWGRSNPPSWTCSSAAAGSSPCIMAPC